MSLRTLIPITLFTLTLSSASFAVAQDGKVEPFSMTMSIITFDGEMAQDTYFVGNHAVVIDGGAPWLVYDLDTMAWHDRISEISVSAERCREWAQDSARKTRASADKPENASVAEFALSLLEPDFEVTEDAGDLVLSNEFVEYRVSPGKGLSPAQRLAFLAYGRIDACYKAMTRGAIPPFPELAVMDELEEREIVPARVSFKIEGGGQRRSHTSSYRFSNLSAEQVARLKEMLD